MFVVTFQCPYALTEWRNHLKRQEVKFIGCFNTNNRQSFSWSLGAWYGRKPQCQGRCNQLFYFSSTITCLSHASCSSICRVELEVFMHISSVFYLRMPIAVAYKEGRKEWIRTAKKKLINSCRNFGIFFSINFKYLLLKN